MPFLVGRHHCPARFDLAEQWQQLCRRDARDRASADSRENERLEALRRVAMIDGGPSPFDVLQPFTRHLLEVVGGSVRLLALFFLSRRGRINAGRQLSARRFASLAGLRQRHVRIGSQGEELFLSGITVPKTPTPAAAWRAQKIQATLVTQLGRLRGPLGLANERVGQHVGVTPRRPACYPKKCPRNRSFLGFLGSLRMRVGGESGKHKASPTP